MKLLISYHFFFSVMYEISADNLLVCPLSPLFWGQLSLLIHDGPHTNKKSSEPENRLRLPPCSDLF